MSQIGPESVVRKSGDAAFRVIDDSAVIVMPRSAKNLTLNEVGTAVWQALDGRSVAELAAEVTRAFEVEEEVALADVITFVVQLEERGMVVVEAPR